MIDGYLRSRTALAAPGQFDVFHDPGNARRHRSPNLLVEGARQQLGRRGRGCPWPDQLHADGVSVNGEVVDSIGRVITEPVVHGFGGIPKIRGISKDGLACQSKGDSYQDGSESNNGERRTDTILALIEMAPLPLPNEKEHEPGHEDDREQVREEEQRGASCLIPVGSVECDPDDRKRWYEGNRHRDAREGVRDLDA